MPYARVKNELPLIPGYAAGNIVTIEAAAAPLNKCVVDILPVQSGAGDPSPSNVRPITGHTELNLVHTGSTTTTDLGTTVYGGTLEVVSGVLTIDRIIVDLGVLTWFQNSSYNEFRASISSNNLPMPKEYASNVLGKWLCSALKPETGNNTYRGTVDYAVSINTSYISASDSSCADATAFTTAMNGVQFVYELATPTTIQLTPQEVNTILGQNNIFADSGDIDIIYIRRNDS